MSQTCTTVTRFRTIPGFFELRDNLSWDAVATSQGSRNYGESFRYSFDPIAGNAFFTGVYDQQINVQGPSPHNYLAAFEVQGNAFRFWLNVGGQPTAVTLFTPFSFGDRLHIQFEMGQITAYKNSDKVWPL